MRRLSSGLPVGAPLLVVISRDGKQIPYRILSPGPAVRLPARNPLAQQGNPVIPPPSETPPGPPGPVGLPAGGNNTVIDNAGPFGAFFGGQSEGPQRACDGGNRAVERAGQHGFRQFNGPDGGIGNNGATDTNQSQNPSASTSTVPPRGRMRIGLAGFHDVPSGLVVMVDVAARPAGTYNVAITDPGVMGGLAGSGAAMLNRSTQTQPQVGAAGTTAATGGGSAIPATSQPQTLTAPAAGHTKPAATPGNGGGHCNKDCANVPAGSRRQAAGTGGKNASTVAQNGKNARAGSGLNGGR